MRPATCRSFDCGWRQLADLGDDWRPDRSGVLINFRAQWEEAVAVYLVIPGPPGDPGHEVRLNGLLEAAVAARSLDRAHEIVRDLVDALPRAAPAPARSRMNVSLSCR